MRKFLIAAVVFLMAAFAFAEITMIKNSNGLSTYYSTELKDYNIMVVDNVEDVKLMNNAWDKNWENYNYPHKSSKVELILPVDEPEGDILELLDITGAVYMTKEDQDGKVCGRYWKNRNGQIFLKAVFWNITN